MLRLIRICRNFGLLIFALRQVAKERRMLVRRLCFEYAYERAYFGTKPQHCARLDRNVDFWGNRNTYSYKHDNFKHPMRMFHQHFHGRRARHGAGGVGRGGFFARRKLASFKSWLLNKKSPSDCYRSSKETKWCAQIPKIGLSSGLRSFDGRDSYLSDGSKTGESLLLENKRTTSNLVGYSRSSTSSTSPGRYDGLLFATRPSELIWRGNSGAAFYHSMINITTSPACLKQRAQNLFQNHVFDYGPESYGAQSYGGGHRSMPYYQSCQSLVSVKQWIKERLSSVAAFAIPQDSSGRCSIYKNAWSNNVELNSEKPVERTVSEQGQNGNVEDTASQMAIVSSEDANAAASHEAVVSMNYSDFSAYTPSSSLSVSSASEPSAEVSAELSSGSSSGSSQEPSSDLHEITLTPLESSAVEFDLRPRLNTSSVGELNQDTVQDLRIAIAAYINYLQSISADIERVSNLGELPFSIENGVIKIHFPNADTTKVNALMSDVEVTAGIVANTSERESVSGLSSASTSASSSSSSSGDAGVARSDSSNAVLASNSGGYSLDSFTDLYGMSSLLSLDSSGMDGQDSLWVLNNAPSLTNSVSSLDAESELLLA